MPVSSQPYFMKFIQDIQFGAHVEGNLAGIQPPSLNQLCVYAALLEPRPSLCPPKREQGDNKGTGHHP